MAAYFSSRRVGTVVGRRIALHSLGGDATVNNTALLPRHSSCAHPQYMARRTFFFPEKPSDNRIKDIQVNPDSVGSQIKPGNLMDKFYKKTGNTRTLPVELALGYFWMIEDLRKCANKPTLSNPKLISAATAQAFPTLTTNGIIKTLTGDAVELPAFFLRKNRSQDETAQSTLVAVSCRDYGFQHTKTWTTPFRQAFDKHEERVEVVHLHLTEGWFTSTFLLQSLIQRTIKNNTPTEDHETTLLCFGKDLEDFRDSLRIHNVMTGYVFLLDGLGRVRFAGSGEASEEEVQRVIQFANQLTPLVSKHNHNHKKTASTGRRKIRSRN